MGRLPAGEASSSTSWRQATVRPSGPLCTVPSVADAVLPAGAAWLMAAAKLPCMAVQLVEHTSKRREQGHQCSNEQGHLRIPGQWSSCKHTVGPLGNIQLWVASGVRHPHNAWLQHSIVGDAGSSRDVLNNPTTLTEPVPARAKSQSSDHRVLAFSYSACLQQPAAGGHIADHGVAQQLEGGHLGQGLLTPGGQAQHLRLAALAAPQAAEVPVPVHEAWLSLQVVSGCVGCVFPA